MRTVKIPKAYSPTGSLGLTIKALIRLLLAPFNGLSAIEANMRNRCKNWGCLKYLQVVHILSST